jgi:hypothetical protein
LLPSGPLRPSPGPVLHRLDCTSFCWRLRKVGLIPRMISSCASSHGCVTQQQRCLARRAKPRSAETIPVLAAQAENSSAAAGRADTSRYGDRGAKKPLTQRCRERRQRRDTLPPTLLFNADCRTVANASQGATRKSPYRALFQPAPAALETAGRHHRGRALFFWLANDHKWSP